MRLWVPLVTANDVGGTKTMKEEQTTMAEVIVIDSDSDNDNEVADCGKLPGATSSYRTGSNASGNNNDNKSKNINNIWIPFSCGRFKHFHLRTIRFVC